MADTWGVGDTVPGARLGGDEVSGPRPEVGGKGQQYPTSPPRHPHPQSSSCREAQKPPPQAACGLWRPLVVCAQGTLHPRPQVLSRARAPPGALRLPAPAPGLTASAYSPFPAPRISAHFLNPQIPPCPALGEVLTQSGGPGTDGASATVPAARWSVGGAAARSLELELSS